VSYPPTRCGRVNGDHVIVESSQLEHRVVLLGSATSTLPSATIGPTRRTALARCVKVLESHGPPRFSERASSGARLPPLPSQPPRLELTHVDTPNYKPVDLQKAGGAFESSLRVPSWRRALPTLERRRAPLRRSLIEWSKTPVLRSAPTATGSASIAKPRRLRRTRFAMKP